MESTGNPPSAPSRQGLESVTSSPTTKQDRSLRTEDDLDNDSDQDDPVFDPPLRRVSAAAAAAGAVPGSHLIDDPPASTTTTTTTTNPGRDGTGTGTAFRDGPVKRKKWGGLVWELENKGAVARDHLALERTFLAWLRTSLALASIGIGQFSLLFRFVCYHFLAAGVLTGRGAFLPFALLSSPSPSLTRTPPLPQPSPNYSGYPPVLPPYPRPPPPLLSSTVHHHHPPPPS